MAIETFEKNHLEKITPSDLPSIHEVSPIAFCNEANIIESVEPIANETDVPGELADRLESFKRNGTEKLEVLYDSEVTEQIADYLSDLEDLKYENWTKLSLEQRKQLLNQIERQIAAI